MFFSVVNFEWEGSTSGIFTRLSGFAASRTTPPCSSTKFEGDWKYVFDCLGFRGGTSQMFGAFGVLSEGCVGRRQGATFR